MEEGADREEVVTLGRHVQEGGCKTVQLEEHSVYEDARQVRRTSQVIDTIELCIHKPT